MRVITYRPGDVLRWTDRLGFDHDAIADETGGVIRPVANRGVIRQPMAEFDPEGRAAAVALDSRRFDHAETLTRARARIGEPRYSLLFDNCQHFCAWCATGERASHQIETALLVAGIVTGIAGVVKVTVTAGVLLAAGATVAYLAGNAVFRRLAPADASAGAVVTVD